VVVQSGLLVNCQFVLLKGKVLEKPNLLLEYFALYEHELESKDTLNPVIFASDSFYFDRGKMATSGEKDSAARLSVGRK
jgi:hypothetical protein